MIELVLHYVMNQNLLSSKVNKWEGKGKLKRMNGKLTESRYPLFRKKIKRGENLKKEVKKINSLFFNN